MCMCTITKLYQVSTTAVKLSATVGSGSYILNS